MSSASYASSLQEANSWEVANKLSALTFNLPNYSTKVALKENEMKKVALQGTWAHIRQLQRLLMQTPRQVPWLA